MPADVAPMILVELPAPMLPADFRAPRTEREAILAGLFAEVLGSGPVGIDDDFFALGGHSLLATRLISRIRATLRVEIGIRAVFEAPTVAGLAERLGVAGGARQVLAPVARPAVLPVSPAQGRLWFLHQLEGPSATYNVPFALRIQGLLDVDALAAAMDDVVVRHESLRTTFGDSDGMPHQEVLAPSAVQVIWTREKTADAAALSSNIADACGYRFDLRSELPIRAWLFDVADDEHVLVIVVHHIASDGWSLSPLWRDLERAYAARRDGAAPDWAPLAVQYADYTLWQRALLDGTDGSAGVLEDQIAYWRGALAGLPEVIALPTDRPRPAIASYRGGTVGVTIDAATHERLVALGRENNATLFMVLHAALAVLLGRLGAGEDIAVGSPIAGRTDSALDDLIGFFVNTLVIRTDLSGDPDFLTVLARVREAALGAYAHQDVPFERLVEDLNPVRSQAHQPLVQVMMVLQNNLERQATLAGLQVEELPTALDTAKFDLTFAFSERQCESVPSGIYCEIEFAVDLLDESTASTLGTRLVRLLKQLVTTPTSGIHRLDILLPHEEEEMSATSQVCFDRGAPLMIEAFAGQCVRTPHCIAVAESERKLSYAQLNGCADYLAQRLLALNVGPGAVVAIVMPRSAEAVIAIIAIAKVGGIFLPIDNDYPAERVNMMLEDADPVCVITRTNDIQHFTFDRTVLMMDGIDDFAVTIDESLRACSLRAEDPAYIIYTSGSTGRPKGVVVSSGSLANYLSWARDAYALAPDDEVPVTTSLSFDGTITSMVLPLMSGATVILPARHEELTALIGRASASQPFALVKLTPSHLDFVNAQVSASSLPRIAKMLIVGGEALDHASVNPWFEAGPGPIFVNEYGPTESTVGCSVHVVYGPATGAVPIGTAIKNTWLYILDHHLRPVADNVPGELYIGGAGLAEGYWRRPGTTASRFVANPFAIGQRIYRTGDLVKRRRNGMLEYLGRTDEQVKIRGFRIEPGEIVALLSMRPDVGQAVVVVREDASGAKQLVGYVTAAGSDHPDPRTLRSDLESKLPGHMVPAAIVVVDVIPLTPNGKLDASRLPAPIFASEAGAEPKTPREQIIADAIGTILGVNTVGRNDNFFDLGGDSIRSIELISRLRKAGLRVSPRDMFRHPTTAGIAAAAELIDSNGVARPTSPFKPTLTDVCDARPHRTVPATPIIKWFLETPGPLRRYHQSMIVQLPCDASDDSLGRAIAAVIDCHDALRLRLNGETLEVLPPSAIHGGTCLATSMDQTDVAAAMRAAEDGLDPIHGRMLRAVRFVHDGTPVLGLVVHHLAIDAVSWQPLIDDLQTAYMAAIGGKAPILERPQISFADWSDLIQQAARDGRFEAERAYWEHVTRLPDVSFGAGQLDPDRDRHRSMRSVRRTLAADISAALSSLKGTTIHEVLLATLGLAIAHWREQNCWAATDYIRIDVEGHGRETVIAEADLGRSIGWFTSLYPVGLQVTHGDESNVSDQIAAMVKQLRDVPHKGIGYGVLNYIAAAGAPKGSAGILFNYLGWSRMPNVTKAWQPIDIPYSFHGEPDRALSHAISINTLIQEGEDGARLIVDMSWAAGVFPTDEPEALIDHWFALMSSAARSDDTIPAGSSTNNEEAAIADMLPPIIPLNPDGSRPPLFCLPALIGIGWSYAGLAARLDNDQPVIALNAPRLTGISVDDSLSKLIDYYVATIEAYHPDGPLALLGWSFGGYVAHALASRFEARGRHISCVIVLDATPPDAIAHYGHGPRSSDDIAKYIDAILAEANSPFLAQPAMRARLVATCAQHGRLLESFVRSNIAAPTHVVEAHRVDLPPESPHHMARWWGTAPEAYVKVPIGHHDLLSGAALDLITPAIARALQTAVPTTRQTSTQAEEAS
ncbi:amino acid adenylation domain-containing protein [Sphingomonas sp. 1185]|uniref:amino acid adenylation domain-containing protein n=1 Tax=Sphingomonas sp. 1185 TaxID=3156411 RepID=UPI00339602B8